MDELKTILKIGYKMELAPSYANESDYILTLMGPIENRRLSVWKQFEGPTLSEIITLAYQYVKMESELPHVKGEFE